MMYRIDEYGELATCTAQCPEEWKGREFYPEEVRRFAVAVLQRCYEDEGLTAELRKTYAEEEAHCVVTDQAGRRINMMVRLGRYSKEAQEAVNKEWLMTEYKKTGALPRVVWADYYCEHPKSAHGRPALLGGRFIFEFQPISLLPDNAPLNNEEGLDAVALARLYAQAWEEQNLGVVFPYLSRDFSYKVQGMFDETPSRCEYAGLFEREMQALRAEGKTIKAFVGQDPNTEEVAVLLTTGHDAYELLLRTCEGCITAVKKKERTKRFVPKLEQTHGRHIAAIIPPEVFMETVLPRMLPLALPLAETQTPVMIDGGKEEQAVVSALHYGDEHMAMLSLLLEPVHDEGAQLVAMYPYLKGRCHVVQIEKVVEWDNLIEATVYASIGEFSFAFFATDYHMHRARYVAGQQLAIELSALGLHIKEAERGFALEGQEAVEWLAKIGEEPELDEEGNVRPIRFDKSQLVGYFNHYESTPDEGEFSSPATQILPRQLLGVDCWECSIILCREEVGVEADVALPLYFRKDFFPNITEADPLTGWLWLSGRLAEG